MEGNIPLKDVETKHVQWYRELIDLGSKESGDCEELSHHPSQANIPWLNPQLIIQGRQFIQRHWFAIFLAHFISLIIGAALKPGISVMIRTGMSHKRENSLRRYLSTALHVQTWYESPSVDIARDIQKVRRLHAKAIQTFYSVPMPLDQVHLTDYQVKILDAVKADIYDVPGPCEVLPKNINSYSPEVPISQLGMVMTQFSFMGFVILFAKKFGIHDTQGIDGYCHLWAVLGKYIGIRDEYNLGLHPHKEVMRRLFDEISVPGLKECDEATMVFWDAITNGVQQYRPFMTMNSVLLFLIQDVIGVEDAKHLKKFMSWHDTICYQILHLLCVYLLQWSLLRWIVNFHSKLLIVAAKKKYF